MVVWADDGWIGISFLVFNFDFVCSVTCSFNTTVSFYSLCFHMSSPPHFAFASELSGPHEKMRRVITRTHTHTQNNLIISRSRIHATRSNQEEQRKQKRQEHIHVMAHHHHQHFMGKCGDDLARVGVACVHDDAGSLLEKALARVFAFLAQHLRW